MTTSLSPLRVLKRQADEIARIIKASERDEYGDAAWRRKVKLARAKPTLSVGVVMDDKNITVELPWSTIRESSEVGLAEYVLKLMRGTREAVH